MTATYGDTQVSLVWSAPASTGGASISDYQVEYKLTSSGSWSVFADGVSDDHTAVVTGLTNALSYDFRVTAVNSIGAGPASDPVSSTPQAFPGAPTGLAAIYGNTQMGLSWTAPASDGGSPITDYIVQYRKAGDSAWITFNDGTSTSTSATITGLINGKAYNFQVKAVTAIGTGVASASVTETPKTVPSAPTIGTATKGNALAIVSFTASTSDGGSDITGYTVTSNPGSISASGSSSPITVTGLTNGVSYTFTVVANNVAGSSSASAASNAVIPSLVPDPPTSLSVSRGGSGQILVSFTPGSDQGSTITSYTAVSTPDGITGTGASSPITVSGLTNGRTYTFTVYATNANGNSLASSASGSISPATVPGSPYNITATRGDASAVISFSYPTTTGGQSVTGYTVTSDPGGVTGTGTTSPITVSGLTNGTSYTFTVTATNSIGTGAAGGPSNAVTPSSDPDVPNKPYNVQATAENAQVTLTWSAPSDGGSTIFDYVIEYKLSTDNSWSVFTDGVTNTTGGSVTGLTNESTYNFRIYAVNSAGTSAASTTISSTPSIGAAVASKLLPGSSDSGYFNKVIEKPDGYPLIAYYDTGSLHEVFVGCTDINCNGYTTSDTGLDPIGYWGLLYFKSDDLPSYIAKDLVRTGTLSRVDCDDVNCTSYTFTSTLFPDTGGNYGPVAGAVRSDGTPFLAMDGVSGMGGILDSFSCEDETCSVGTRRTLDTNGAGVNPAVAILGDDRPVVSYYDTSSYSLKLYVCSDALCTSGSSQTLHAGSSSAHYGEMSSIVIRADGTPGIAYTGPSGLLFYDCPNSSCTGGTSDNNSYSVHDEQSAAVTSFSNYGGTLIQLDSNDNPVIMSAGARRKGYGNVSVYECYNSKCSEGRFRTLLKDSSNRGGYPSFYIRGDGGYVIAYHNYSGNRPYLYNYLPTTSSHLSGLDTNLSVAQVSRVDPVNVQTSSYSDPLTQNFVTSVVDLRVTLASGVPLSDVTVTFPDSGNLFWPYVSGDSDRDAGKAVIAGLGISDGTDSTHSLYVPKRAQDGGVRICPDAETLPEVTDDCVDGYELTAGSASVSIVSIDGLYYWKITGLSGTGGIGVPLVGAIGLTLTPNAVAISSDTDIVAHWVPSGEMPVSGTAAVDFPAGFTLADTCSVPTTDADSDSIMDGSATITTDGFGNPRYLYTFTAPTTTASVTGLDFCIHVTAPATAGNYEVDAYDSLGGFGSAPIYVGSENQVNILATVDTVLTFVIRTSDDTADLGNVGGSSVGPNLCDLGSLSDSGVQECAYRLKVTTNATSGYTVNIKTDGSLRNTDDSEFIDNVTDDSLVTAGTEGYGISLVGGSCTGDPFGLTELGTFAVDDSPTATGVTSGINTSLYSCTSGNNPSSPDTTNTALVTHRAEADSGTPAGTYTQLVTYTVSASF